MDPQKPNKTFQEVRMSLTDHGRRVFDMAMMRVVGEACSMAQEQWGEASGLEATLEKMERLFDEGMIRFCIGHDGIRVLFWDKEKGEYE